MSTDFMMCNVTGCNIPLTNEAWVTRCSHTFCVKHGNEYFNNKSRKVKCPACNELKNRESGVIKSNLNPHDMVIACLRPDKALELASQACKVWSYQMKVKQQINLNNISAKYEINLTNVSEKLQAKNYELRKVLKMVDEKLKTVNQELSLTKRKLQKYMSAYESLSLKTDQGRIRMPLTQSTHVSQFNSQDYGGYQRLDCLNEPDNEGQIFSQHLF